ncbi:Xaa-Pro aminopeptidase [Deinococcus metalli]|uniref:Xaa-Pro aminopeptidase n=1 Tax=Deinococcus metalli TaxID=1141878 RepID=A0A7W8KF44_9DEIO|nr:Xaa-Pro peptidase family protein [Deinococcus metalli]MBB5376603.1 Xaa-Pro aminopeptidase [Deinococcus metalli]GHF42848.1 Xaa-Pro aminopeptidase [Deinococcus metalli]
MSESTRLEITAAEHAGRRARLAQRLQDEGLDAICVFGPVRVAYLTGFHFAATERPVGVVLSDTGEVTTLLPALEETHFAQQCPDLPAPLTYPEYPGGGTGRHPLSVLADHLRARFPAARRIAADHDGYENRWGYRGPALSALLGQPVHPGLELIDDLRMVKSAAEIELIREACRWGDHAHRVMQNSIAPGANELLVSHGASLQATRDMLAALGERYVPKSREGLPANAMFISGANTAHPHGLHQSVGVMAGDVLVTGAYGTVGGYESELERTMHVGDPTPEFERYFAAMLGAQNAGLAALRPGRTCAQVEADVRAFIEDQLGMTALVRHHTGHAFGLEGHEHPFLDLDDHTPVEPGMIFSIEPGLYVPGLAGFRHSDTVLVTETGSELLSVYPRELADLIIPA